MISPNTATVSESLVSTGVPVKPIKEAFGRAVLKFRAKPCSSPYCVQ
jgi:hypothetical protein